MTRVLFIQPVAEAGGSDHALLRMATGLSSSEFDCHVVMPGPSPLGRQFRAAGVTCHTIPMRRITTSGDWAYWLAYLALWPITVWRILRLMRQLDVDLVVTNSLHSLYGWASAWLANKPHIWCAREIVTQSPAALKLERFLAKRFATKVVAASEAIASQLDGSNLTVMYDADPGEEFSPSAAGKFRAHEGIADDVPVITTIGRIDTWKGIDVAIEAFLLVRGQFPQAHLVIAGSSVVGKEEYATSLQDRSQRVGNVHWLGPRSDIPEILADSDAFVLASTQPEPFGLVLVEALACGVPVVATDAGGPPEILEMANAGSHGLAGHLVPPGDAGALAKALSELLSEIADTGTSSTTRSTRPELWTSERPDYAGLYQAALEGQRR